MRNLKTERTNGWNTLLELRWRSCSLVKLVQSCNTFNAILIILHPALSSALNRQFLRKPMGTFCSINSEIKINSLPRKISFAQWLMMENNSVFDRILESALPCMIHQVRDDWKSNPKSWLHNLKKLNLRFSFVPSNWSLCYWWPKRSRKPKKIFLKHLIFVPAKFPFKK